MLGGCSMPTNDDLVVERIGRHLEGKNIALCVSGGIAAIETPKIARHLRRYGATVRAYATHTAFKFVGEAALEWGTGQSVVKELSGLAEHICLEDLVLVAPATLNTINKIMTGLADDPVTTLIASALGKKIPVCIAPTMHESLYHNPFLQQNLHNAYAFGIQVIPPRESEGKSKIPDLESLIAFTCKTLSQDPLKGKKVLVTGGPTPAKIDDVRAITNKFKGALSVLIASEAYRRGALVKLLLGDTGIPFPTYLEVRKHHDYERYRTNVFSELERGYDVGIFAAAVADYTPVEFFQGKIPSGGTLTRIDVRSTPKVIEEVRHKYPELFMATFKYQQDVSKEELLAIAQDRVQQGYELVVANRGEDITALRHKAYIFGKEGVLAEPGSKKEIANQLLDVIGLRMER